MYLMWAYTHTLSYSSDTSVAPDLKLSQVGGGVSTRHAKMNCFSGQNTRCSCDASESAGSDNYVYAVQQIELYMCMCIATDWVAPTWCFWPIHQKKTLYMRVYCIYNWGKPNGNYLKKLSEKWMKNKVNTMHVLELAIGFTSNYETVNWIMRHLIELVYIQLNY